MSEYLRDRVTLNRASFGDTEIRNDINPEESLSMETIATPGHHAPVIQPVDQPDQNGNRPAGRVSIAAVGRSDAQNGAATLTSMEEIDVPELLMVEQKSAEGGCYNPAFEPDGDTLKYRQPDLTYEEYDTGPSSDCHVLSRRTVVVVMTLMACVLIAIVFFMVGNLTANGSSQNGATTSASTITPVSRPSVTVVASVSLTLEEEYVQAYSDPTSIKYKMLERRFVLYIGGILQSSHLRESLGSIAVEQFRPGSVIVEFTVTLTQIASLAGDLTDTSYVHTMIKTEIEYILTDGISSNNGTNLVVVEGSVSVSSVVLVDVDSSVVSTMGGPTPTEQNQGVINTDVCGLRPGYNQPFHRIIQGETTENGKWPWLLSLQILARDTDEIKHHMCGATLISDQWATTAAHCVASPNSLGAHLDEVLVGDINLEMHSPYHQVIPIERIIIYPGYNARIYLHDIALLKLARPVEVTDHARPVCLDRLATQKVQYRRCYVAGWGRTQYGGNISVNLLDAQMNLMETSECIQSYESFRKIGYSPTEGSICAEPAEYLVEAGPCSGDSGGPLMCEGDDNRWYMVGIISLGVACNSTAYPMVATRVSAYSDFIVATIDGDSYSANCEELQSERCSGILPYRSIYSTSTTYIDAIVDSMLSINRSCSEHIESLVCSLVYTGCAAGGRSLVPCRGYCETVATDCDDAYEEATGFSFLTIAKCDRLPEASSPYQMICYDDEDSRCGNQSVITLPLVGHVRLESYNYSGPYGSYLDCVYVVTAPPSHRVLVKTREMSVQEEDMLEMGDGHDAYNKTSMFAELRGSDEPSVILSKGELMWIRFTSGDYVSEDIKGFDLEIHAIDRNNVSSLCNRTVDVPDWWICDEIIDCPTGLDETNCTKKLPDVLNTAICGLQTTVSQISTLQHRIVNGTKVEPGAWPWLAYLQLDEPNGIVVCGATLIADQWATTAAHCVSGHPAYTRVAPPPKVPIQRIYRHPGYNSKILLNDIALLKLSRPMDLTMHARPVCLETDSDIIEKYTTCYAAGWGRTQYGGERSDHLLEADLALVTLEDCTELYKEFQIWGLTITDRVVCVKPADLNVSSTACNGDSGGPVMCQGKDGRWTMVGIISLGVRCSSHPVVTTRVSSYIEYISNVIQEDPHPAKCDKLQSDTCSALLPYDQIYPTSQNDFEPVIATLLDNNVTCGDTNLTQFMCLLLFQPCSDDGRSRVLCREYCDDVVSRCHDEYSTATGMPLEYVVQCSRFPDAGRSDQMFCYQDEDARCGNQTEIKLSSKDDRIVLKSHNYPEPYGTLLDCITLVNVPPGYRLVVKVRDLDVEANWETLALGTGNDAYDKITTLVKFHQMEDLKVLITPGSTLWIRFTTFPRQTENRGYTLEIYAVNQTVVPFLCNNESSMFPYTPPDWWMCDGIVDCPGGVDEEGCSTATEVTPAPVNNVFNQEGCGVQSTTSSFRIVGGTDADPAQWPWLGSLRKQGTNKHGCAVSLIAPQWVITAAHCVSSLSYSTGIMVAVFGDIKLNETSADHIEIPVEYIFSHPGFNRVTIENDIAILKLARPVTYTDHVRPVCLNTAEIEVDTSDLCYVAGWGLTNLSTPILSVSLQELEVDLVTRNDCLRSLDSLGLLGIVTDSILCAEGVDGQSPCSGDSGGALVCRNNQSVWYEVGIISVVYGCSSHYYPGLYTRVSSFIDFISSTLRGDPNPSCEDLQPRNCANVVQYTNTYPTSQSYIEDIISRSHGLQTCNVNATEFMCMVLMPGCNPAVVPCRGFCQKILEDCSDIHNDTLGETLQIAVDCEIYPVGPSRDTVACIHDRDARCNRSDDDGHIYVTADNHVILYSPHYPSYDAVLSCMWFVTGPATSQGLLIKFLALDFNVNGYNVLSVGLGHELQNLSTVLVRYNGSYNADPLLVKSRQAWIWFSTGKAPIASPNTTDEVTYPGGFKLEIHATDITDTNSLCTEPRTAESTDLTSMPAWWYCDNFPDCPSGIDERDCPSPWYNQTFESVYQTLFKFYSETDYSASNGHVQGIGPGQGYCRGGLFNSSTCGKKGSTDNPSLRIVGGSPAVAGTWPWMVSLRDSTDNNTHQCGATLISEYWAITAAHCVDFFDFAVLGDVTINDPSPHHVKRQVKDVYSYRLDSNVSFNSVDLALVRLSHPVQLNDHVNIACLPPPGLPFRVNATGYIIGWGYLEMDGKVSNSLQEVEVPIMNTTICQDLAPTGVSVDHKLICAGYLEGGVDTCKGDSGGPLLYQGDDERWYVAGVTNFGFGCAMPNNPGYYLEVASYTEFILAVVSGEDHSMAVKTEIYP